MKACRSLSTLVMMILGGTCVVSLGQESITAPESSALNTARVEFSAKVLADSRQLTEQYVRALAKLEDELAAAGDYEDAISVQKRIADLGRILAKTPLPESGPTIPLLTSSARLSGVTLDESYLTRWRTAGSHAEWSVQKLTPGTYTIEILYLFTDGAGPLNGSAVSVAPPTEARFRFQEVSLLTSSSNFRDLALKRADNQLTYTVLRTEPITFTRSAFTLRLEALQNYGNDLVRIGSIKFVPADPLPTTPPSTASIATDTGEKEVESLRQVFLKQLAATRAPLLSDYEARLKTIKALPEVSEDAELSEIIAAEQKRIAAGSATSPRLGKIGSLEKFPGASLDGFEDINGARWVPDPENTAERFKVAHEGREFWVRLAWVKCPPPTADDKGELRSAAKAFGIDEDDALAIGRVALEYSRGYLEGKPLRLLVRSHRKDKKEAAPALVFLDGVGFFQPMLIDYGFATYAPPEGQGQGQKSLIELAMMRMLKERQDKAAAKDPAPGAWAFRAAQVPKP